MMAASPTTIPAIPRDANSPAGLSSTSKNNLSTNTNTNNNNSGTIPAKDQPSVEESLRLIDDLKFFLATAPANWQENQIIRRYYLNHDEGFVSCVFWNNLYFVTGTDIVKCLIYRFEQFGRTITDRKKFEEGVFSDLRNLKCGTDAILEPPKSKFLEFLYKNSCLRTQKKQKVFFWFSVQHDKLFADALERDLKREMVDQKTTTLAEREPAKSFKYDDSKSLYEQLQSHIDEKKKALGVFINPPGPPPMSNGIQQSAPAPPPGIQNGINIGPENPYAFLQMNSIQQQHQQQQLQFNQQLMPSNPALAYPSLQQPNGVVGSTEPFDENTGNAPEYTGTEDDFPLDFFPHNDFISETVDPSQAFAPATVPLFDPSIFLNPAAIMPGATGNSEAFGNDFLIDNASFSPAANQEFSDEKRDYLDMEPNELNETSVKQEDQSETIKDISANNNNLSSTPSKNSNTNKANSIPPSMAHPTGNPNEFVNPGFYNAGMAMYPQFLQGQMMVPSPMVPPGNEFMINPYFPGAAAAGTTGDPYLDQMAVFQSQQQMLGLMNPMAAMAAAQIPMGSPNGMISAAQLNQLQRQKLQQQGGPSARMSKLRQQQLSSKISKPSNNSNNNNTDGGVDDDLKSVDH